jgi:hypothetical protein
MILLDSGTNMMGVDLSIGTEVNGWTVGAGVNAVCGFGAAYDIFVENRDFGTEPNAIECIFEKLVSDDPTADTIVSANLIYKASWPSVVENAAGSSASISLGGDPVAITVDNQVFDGYDPAPAEREMDVTASLSSAATSVVFEAITNIGAAADPSAVNGLNGSGVYWKKLQLDICRAVPEDEPVEVVSTVLLLLARDDADCVTQRLQSEIVLSLTDPSPICS